MLTRGRSSSFPRVKPYCVPCPVLQLKEAREAHTAILDDLEEAQAVAEAEAKGRLGGPQYEPEYAPEGYEGPPPPQLKGGAVTDVARALFSRALWGSAAGAAGGGATAGGGVQGKAEEAHQQQSVAVATTA